MQLQALEMPDAEVLYCEQFYSQAESDEYLQRLQNEIQWQQKSIKMFGREIQEPRLTAWYGDENAVYTYSGYTNIPLKWTTFLLEIKQRCETISAAKFNSVLLNYYRDGNDSMGWHQDNERELGEAPVIASISFGAVRRFQLRHKKRKELPTINVDLGHGSLLLMRGATQQFWKHQLPKTAQLIGARVNLTFRYVFQSANN